MIVSQDDYVDREITIEVIVRGETETGASTTLANMVAIQAGNQVENTFMLTCAMGDLPEEPAKPEAPPEVTKLPETGHGGVASLVSLPWVAAMLGTLLLGTAAIGVRSRR